MEYIHKISVEQIGEYCFMSGKFCSSTWKGWVIVFLMEEGSLVGYRDNSFHKKIK